MQHTPLGADGVLVVVAGEIDLATMPRFRDGITAALAAAPPSCRQVVVDLDAVGVLEPVAMGVLLEARLRVHDRGAVLVLLVTSERLRRLLDRTGLAAAIPVVAEVPAV